MIFNKDQTKKVILGLEGIKVVATIKSKVDGTGEGALYYEGYNIIELAEKSNYEEVAYLLLHDKFPNKVEFEQFRNELKKYSVVDDNIIEIMKKLGTKGHPMAVLRTLTSALSSFDNSNEDYARALRLIVQLPIIVACYYKIRQGKEIIKPIRGLSIAENFVLMIEGKEDKLKSKIIDLCFLLHADHGLNASTFAARQTASTETDLYSAITSAIGALKGPLHGGANEEVIKMLLETDNIEKLVLEKLSKKEKIMGMGHKVYKGGDPRARILKNYAKELCEKTDNVALFAKAEIIEKIMGKEKGLKPNVDFYSAIVYHCLGITPDLYTAMFASSRISGWTAHVLEQYENNELMRPKSEYVEELAPLGRKYIEMRDR